MTRPSAAIVITNFNYARYVRHAVDSALNQTVADVEVIVVDDGSTDESLAVLAGFAEDLTVIAQPNLGQAAAFNAGFAASRAAVVLFLDADDLLDDDAVERVLAAFAGDPRTVRVQFQLAVIDETGRATGDYIPTSTARLTTGDVGNRLTRFPDDIPWQPTSGNAFRRSVLDEILPMPVEPFRICADYYLSNLSCLYGRVAALDSAAGSYRAHGNNYHFGHERALAGVRGNIVRTTEVHRLLIAQSRRTGRIGLPDDPTAVRSVTAAAHRLISLRSGPGHPLPADTVLGLVRLGVRAAWGRFDVPPRRRIAMAGWFVAMAVAPRTVRNMLSKLLMTN